eukprot:865247-Amphidinium_carterae.1
MLSKGLEEVQDKLHTLDASTRDWLQQEAEHRKLLTQPNRSTKLVLNQTSLVAHRALLHEGPSDNWCTYCGWHYASASFELLEET